MTFPHVAYSNVVLYGDDYFAEVIRAAGSIVRARLEEAAERLLRAYREGRTVFVCGNGGSASISEHLACDHLKGAQTDTSLRPRVVSLSSNLALVTAIANDIGFDDVFVYQLRSLAERGDVLITISSSGDSENVVQAVQWARANGVETIAMTGFSGGRSGELAETHLHVEADNYGVIEDVHQSIMHILSQYLRLTHMTEALIAQKKF
jgi:D-sedoheptulose 7-phosphate isomerase